MVFFKKKENLKKFMNSSPLFISETSSASKALSIMNEKKITSLLVTSEKNVNTTRKYVDLKGLVHIHSILQFGVK